MQSMSSSRSMLAAPVAPRPLSARHMARRTNGLVIRAQQSNNPVEGLINGLTTFINSSPLAEGKKALAIAQAGDYDVEATQAKIQELIASNPCVVFSWQKCPFCVKAKAQLDSLGANYTAVELDTMPENFAFRAELAKMTGRTSVPNVYISGISYGGANDGPGILSLHKKGELVPLLQAAGAL